MGRSISLLCAAAALLSISLPCGLGAPLAPSPPISAGSAPPKYKHYGQGLLDLIISLTHSRFNSGVSAEAYACLESELPESSPIWVDERGMGAGDTPEAYIQRTLLQTHPDTAGFIACMLHAGAVPRPFLERSGGPLLLASASLVAATTDPTHLFTGFLRAGAPVNHTLGLEKIPASLRKQRGAVISDGGDGYNVLHKLLGRDKMMLADVANRLLQPSSSPAGAASSHYGLYLSAVADSLASRLVAAGRPVEEGKRVRSAVKSLLANADVLGEGEGDGVSEGGKTKTKQVLGRRVAYAHLQTLSNAMSTVCLHALLQHLRGVTVTGAVKTKQESAPGAAEGVKNEDADGASGLSVRASDGASASPLVALILQQDKYGRTPLHVASLTDNAPALDSVISELRAQSNESLASALLVVDVFGYSPRALAVLLGHSKSGAVLAAAERELGLTSLPESGEGPADADGGDESAAPSSSSTTSVAAHSSEAAVAGAESLPPTQPLARPFRRGRSRTLRYDESGSLVEVSPTPGSATPASGTLASESGSGSQADNYAVADGWRGGHGGWSDPAFTPVRYKAAVNASLAHSSGCDMDVIDFTCEWEHETAARSACLARVASNSTLLARDILRHYYVPGRPVLLRGLARSWPIREAWGKDNLLARHGAAPMSSSAIPYASVFGAPAAKVTLAQHVKGFLECTPGMAQGTEKAPDGLDAATCALYVGAEGSRVPAPGPGVGTGKSASSASSASASASSAHPYVFNRLGRTEPLAAALVDDMTILPWFLDAVLPRRVAPARKTEQVEVAVDAATGAASAQAAIPVAAKGPGDNGLMLTAPSHPEPLMLPLPEPPSPQFYVGGPGSGAPPHYHEEAVNVLAHGEKRWYIVPPAAAEYTTVPVSDYVLDVLPRLKDRGGGKTVTKGSSAAGAGGVGGGNGGMWGPGSRPLVCTQRAGDVIFVPGGWGHAVLNTETVIGYAVEFHSPFQRY
jgi:hypothetical protein